MSATSVDTFGNRKSATFDDGFNEFIIGNLYRLIAPDSTVLEERPAGLGDLLGFLLAGIDLEESIKEPDSAPVSVRQNASQIVITRDAGVREAVKLRGSLYQLQDEDGTKLIQRERTLEDVEHEKCVAKLFDAAARFNLIDGETSTSGGTARSAPTRSTRRAATTRSTAAPGSTSIRAAPGGTR